MNSYGYLAIDAKALVGGSYVVAALVVLATGWLAMPLAARLQFKPNRSIDRFLADQVLRLAVITYVFALFFVISWRPIYSCLATISFFLIFAGISRAKFNFIREPLIFTDLALVLDVLKYKEIFYATWINKIFWAGACLYVFGLSALFMVLEPHLLPKDQPFLAYGLGLVAWLCPFVVVFWRPLRILVCKLARMAVGSHELRGNILRFGTFEYLALNFLMWFGTVRVGVVDDLADDLDHMLRRLLDTKDRAQPLIVVWQSESFLDMRRVGLDDVCLPNLDAVRRRALRWGLLKNVFEGGYTMRTEFSVLSGLRPEAVGLDASYPYLRARDYSGVAWPMRLHKAGWRTHFIHPYDRTFFRRHRAMPELGFSKMTMLDAFDHEATSNTPYVSDEALADRVVDICKKASPADPMFMFVASMGNHGPWHQGRVADAASSLDIYCRLLEEADTALGSLVHELDTLQRPVWLAFYGDHAPLLKDFADPFPDPRTDYAIVPLAEAAKGTRFDSFAADINAWNLIGLLAQVAGLRPPPEGEAPGAEPAVNPAPTI